MLLTNCVIGSVLFQWKLPKDFQENNYFYLVLDKKIESSRHLLKVVQLVSAGGHSTCWEAEWSSHLLASVWPRPGCCGCLRSEQEDECSVSSF